MAKLPYSRVVNVTLTRSQSSAARRGFGVALLLTTVAVAGILDATYRTKVYGSMEEIVVDHASNTDVYKAAEAAFSQNPKPMQIKVGFATFVPATGTAAELKAQLDLIYAYDSEWYWIGLTAPLRDRASLDGLVEWVTAKRLFAMIDSNDAGTEASNNTTCVAARHKNTTDRAAVFYHTDAAEYGGFALAALLGTFNFDNASSAYTAKFKKLVGVSPLNKSSAVVQAVTGFTPGIGQAVGTGHMANAQIDIGGQNFVIEGSTLTPNVFIDEVHATDWIIARTEEQALNLFLNQQRIPFTDVGMETLASAARVVMNLATLAGLIAEDIDLTTGLYKAAIRYEIPKALSVPESQRKARIAPPVRVHFRYAGAVHWTQIDYYMSF